MTKTSKEIEADIKLLQNELAKVRVIEAQRAEPLPDILVKFKPKEIDEVLDLFESKDNCKKWLKNATESNLKYGIEKYEFVHEVNSTLIFGDWIVTVVDQQGGGEGSGEHWHCVFSVTYLNGTAPVGYYYIPGYYASYAGTEIEWSDIYEVEPYEKTVTDWRKK